MVALTGFVATRPDFQGSTPVSLRDGLAQTAINGLNRYIDLELSERFGRAPNTLADVAYVQPAGDPNQPATTAPATKDRLAAMLPFAALALGVVGVIFIARSL